MTTSQSHSPQEFLRIAEFLAENAPSEAGFRSAISRTYYGVFHIARLTLNVQGRRNIHHRVIDSLSWENRRAADALDRLRTLRNMADYRLEVEPELTNWQANYELSRTLANEVLDGLNLQRT